MPLIRDILPFINTAIRPAKPALGMHFIIQPSAGIISPIRPENFPFSIKLVIFPFALIDRPIDPGINAITGFNPFAIISFENISVFIDLCTGPVHFIVNPITAVRAASPFSVDTFSVAHVIAPFAFIGIPGGVDLGAYAGDFVGLPGAGVDGPVRPQLLALAVAEPVFPTALENCAVVEPNLTVAILGAGFSGVGAEITVD